MNNWQTTSIKFIVLHDLDDGREISINVGNIGAFGELRRAGSWIRYLGDNKEKLSVRESCEMIRKAIES